MIKNALLIAWRRLFRDGSSSILNLVGLSVGMTCALLIGLWVANELNIDGFYNKQLYQVMQNVPEADKSLTTIEQTPDLLAKTLKNEIPAIEDAVIVKTPDPDETPFGILQYGNNSRIKARELFVTSNFFDAFSCDLIQGSARQVLSAPGSIVLSETVALKLFHSTNNIIGKTINWNRGPGHDINGSYMITGIFKAPPAKASLQFDVLFSHDRYVQSAKDDINWNSSSPFTFVVLKKGSDLQLVNKQIKDLIYQKTGSNYSGTLFLQRYADKYLHGHYQNGIVAGGRIQYVVLFSMVALFILLIACINFMNLSTAKATVRLKEVGVKKVMGASRRSLMLQYLIESLLMAFVSLVVAIVSVKLLLPLFGQIIGSPVDIDLGIGSVLVITGITIITGLIAGSHPALYLSGFQPIMILKGRSSSSSGGAMIRKGLVIFQFCISVMLIVSVLIVYRQMHLIQKKNLGYNKDHVIRFANTAAIQQALPAMLSDLNAVTGVAATATMEGDLFGNHGGGGGVNWPGKTEPIEFNALYVGMGFTETMQMKIKEGHSFSGAYGTDTAGVIFNETAIAAMRIKDPIGKKVTLWGHEKHIIGIVKDFNYESLYKKVGPLFLSYRNNTANTLVRIKAGSEKETLAKIGSVYKRYDPGIAFEYYYLNDDHQKLYATEQRVSTLARYFAAIAVLISCLGLFGLATFTMQQKQKEIGIRKVLGASIANLSIMLSTDLLKLVLIAFVIAAPLSWLVLEQWLRGFAFRINISIGLYVITGLGIIGITLLTIGFQTIKAALANPIKSLTTE